MHRLNLIRYIVAFSVLVGISNGFAFGGLGDALSSARDIGMSLLKEKNNILPGPEDLFDMGKQLLAGLPFEFVSSAINTICSKALAARSVQPKFTPSIDKLNFQLRTACTRETFYFTQADEIFRSPNFNSTKPVVIFATGWTTTVNDTEAIDTFAKAYACRGDTNFIAVDVGHLVDTLYTWSAFNTDKLGELISIGLEKLVKIVPEKNIHLIGHSLGAHIVGAAGRYFYERNGKLISRITGLDPAKPCFNEGETLSGLLRGDADYIDIIHSNPGVLGKRDPIGDADFYPGGLTPLPNGCVSVICAHARAWKYYAETIYPGNEGNFMARRCSSLTSLRDNRCPQHQKIMGHASPKYIKGNYFLEVNDKEPYGKHGNAKLIADQHKCGLCSQRRRKK